MALAGIKYLDDTISSNRYVRIDLRRHGKNQLIEDFLDGQEAMACRGGETIPLREFMQYQNQKRGLNV